MPGLKIRLATEMGAARRRLISRGWCMRLRRVALLVIGLLAPGAFAAEVTSPSVPAPSTPFGGSVFTGHFRLTAPDGAIVDSDALAGRPYGLFFGFTHCPDICPTTLASLSAALARLPAGSPPLYFVSVDPERDTPEVLARYMANFDPRIVALSGTRGAVDAALASFGAVARRTDQPGGGYTYGHTAAILLVDGDGLIVDRIGMEAGPDRLAERLAALGGSGPAGMAVPVR